MGYLLEGVSPAIVTPFLPEGGIHTGAVEQLVALHLQQGAKGFYICGNTGEGFAATADERRAMCEATVKAVNGKVPIVVHVGATDLETACALAKHAKETGAQGVSSVVPLDSPGNLDAAIAYWKVLGAATDLPFYIYWVKDSADHSVTPGEFYAAAKTVPHLAGFKFTDSNLYMFERLQHVSGYTLNAISGPDEMNVAALAMGAHGAIGSTYNTHCRVAAEIYDQFRQGNVKAAMARQVEMNNLIAVLIEQCCCRIKGTNIVAGIKAILRAQGIPVGQPRAASLKGLDMSEAWEKEIVAAYKAAFPADLAEK